MASGQDSQLFSLKGLQVAVLLNPSGEETNPSLFTKKLSQNPYHFSNMEPQSTDKATSQGREEHAILPSGQCDPNSIEP